jgi:hypothetical protein
MGDDRVGMCWCAGWRGEVVMRLTLRIVRLISFRCMARSQITGCVEVGVVASAGGQSAKECRDCKRYFGLTYVFHWCNAYVGMYMLFDCSLSFLLKSTLSCQRICASRVWREHFKRTSLYHLTFMSGQRIHALIPAWPMHASQRQKQRCRPP